VNLKPNQRRTSAAALELTSAMGWSSFVCGPGRSGH
jgi:hypothetical protein